MELLYATQAAKIAANVLRDQPKPELDENVAGHIRAAAGKGYMQTMLRFGAQSAPFWMNQEKVLTELGYDAGLAHVPGTEGANAEMTLTISWQGK